MAHWPEKKPLLIEKARFVLLVSSARHISRFSGARPRRQIRLKTPGQWLKRACRKRPRKFRRVTRNPRRRRTKARRGSVPLSSWSVDPKQSLSGIGNVSESFLHPPGRFGCVFKSRPSRPPIVVSLLKCACCPSPEKDLFSKSPSHGFGLKETLRAGESFRWMTLKPSSWV